MPQYMNFVGFRMIAILSKILLTTLYTVPLSFNFQPHIHAEPTTWITRYWILELAFKKGLR